MYLSPGNDRLIAGIVAILVAWHEERAADHPGGDGGAVDIAVVLRKTPTYALCRSWYKPHR
jgi:hypothetical protein